jgi:CO/xanthine dehydrogenase Mo-binding subunit
MNRREFLGTTFSSAALILAASLDTRTLHAATRSAPVSECESGNVEAGFSKGARIVEAEYYLPHLAHATLEPPVALASFQDGKLSVWVPTQDPQGVQEAVAKAVGIPKENGNLCQLGIEGQLD